MAQLLSFDLEVVTRRIGRRNLERNSLCDLEAVAGKGDVLRGLLVAFVGLGLEVAQELCDRIGIILKGELVACGTMDELRGQAETERHDLEEIFLKLTAGEGFRESGAGEGLRES